MAEQGPETGHLGTAWEIAVITVFVVLVVFIGGTVLFQIRRKQKRTRQRQMDAEQQQHQQSIPRYHRDPQQHQTQDAHSHSQNGGLPSSAVAPGLVEQSEYHSGWPSIQKPSPTAKQHPSIDSAGNFRAQDAPRYYWRR